MALYFSMQSMQKASTEDMAKHLGQSSPGGLRSVSLFSNLSNEEIAYFQDAAQARSYDKGKILYLQDEPAEFFYVICSGWIKLFYTMPEGEEVIIDMLTTGHLVGESAIFELGRHTSSAQVIEKVQLLSIPSRLLKERIRLSPALALSMISSMFRHHRRHYGEIALNAMQSAPQRIGCFLLRLCPPDKKKRVVFELPYDKTLIASTLGMKGATFSRALNILRQKTALRINGTRVEIDSVDQLAKFVYGSLAAKYAPENM
jgi:CRP-like cAMP-binding protein